MSLKCMSSTKTHNQTGRKQNWADICLICLLITNLSKYVQFFNDLVGKGSYGVVVAAKNHNKNGELVAIKKMINVFEHKTFARRTLR